jgi:hypothetical protein
MTGYRQHSFDPNAYEQPGPPLRPFTWVQWLGFALGLVGLALSLAYLVGDLGWIEPVTDSAAPSLALMLAGAALINSRRGPASLVGPEQRRRHRNILIVTLAVCAVILGMVVLVRVLP